jgi:hypothetical protein
MLRNYFWILITVFHSFGASSFIYKDEVQFNGAVDEENNNHTVGYIFSVFENKLDRNDRVVREASVIKIGYRTFVTVANIFELHGYERRSSSVLFSTPYDQCLLSSNIRSENIFIPGAYNTQKNPTNDIALFKIDYQTFDYVKMNFESLPKTGYAISLGIVLDNFYVRQSQKAKVSRFSTLQDSKMAMAYFSVNQGQNPLALPNDFGGGMLNNNNELFAIISMCGAGKLKSKKTTPYFPEEDYDLLDNYYPKEILDRNVEIYSGGALLNTHKYWILSLIKKWEPDIFLDNYSMPVL